MDRDPRAPRLSPRRIPGPASGGGPAGAWRARALAIALVVSAACGCARMGLLEFGEPVAPVLPDTALGARRVHPSESETPFLGPLFGDTLIGFLPGTGDSAKRFLGRLRDGYTADTLNFFIFGDNRPAYRVTELRNQTQAMKNFFTLKPINWLKGLVAVPVFLFKGTFPDFKFWRDIPSLVTRHPTYGREASVVKAMLTKLDSIQARGQVVAAAINSGDLVKDGRYPKHWERFLSIVRPLSSRVPYFAVAGNHERTDDSIGLANWHTATGLPIKGDRMYYCFDTADGWVRVLALDSNPMTDPAGYWSREVEVRYSDEEIQWAVDRLAEHPGPAIVVLHHPPFSVGFHRSQWQLDSVLVKRREQLVLALLKANLSVMLASHEHAYQRAILTCGDAVMIVISTGGAGAPLYHVPIGDEAARMFSDYQIPGCRFKPENAFASVAFHFTHLRIWFGGGEIFTYAVDDDANLELIDHVQADLERFGIPKIDQKKIPVIDKGPTQPAPPEEEPGKPVVSAEGADSAKADAELKKPPPAEPKKQSTRPRRRR